ncbi:transcriptional regulator [Streptomyces cinereoruber]|uniref:Transcriptional regulator n=1 Tax=Streptomyces cinereoruber TaxID=67260 RepID=A0AAV4KRI0_9ACTN|nr:MULTISPECIES: MerR family transcriptional regulator [Streptomyces]MBB4160832.1 DNA-binding transcriptional MerR regulator [Streptomyces cinereoruber]MBY8820362.1 MerR family transcriptional regulator [Streptomyces cinereoruber]NIH62649.1 DNA-binding transcriptional MerR regulator [Streptomyces cinereoruber]PVC68649.1 MerR family transcriptional regulator [Streptomyces sp. CS081A]QEV31737.1 MerR family transcriptional regulator [Streptomyces cinereoruber]
MLIGDVARRSGVSARMLRHYESLGLVRPTGRTGSGYREYSDEDIRRIFHIESLRSLGLSLREVGRALDDPGFAPAELVADLARRTRERIAAETELLTRLRRIDAAGPAGWEDVLRTVALLQALGSNDADARQRAALSTSEETSLPVEALVEAVLDESDPNVAGALRWALARTDGDAPALLAEGLDSPTAEVRERAVRSLAELPDDEATTALLRDALAHPDATVRRHAAVALGARGAADTVPVLVDMVVGETGRTDETEGTEGAEGAVGTNDVDAADTLSALADDPVLADRIAGALVDRLSHATTGTPARRRLTQALADIPGPTASRALEALSHDEDPAVALTARYVLELRAGR